MKKLRSRRGESIAETLVAVLISAMAIMILAGAIITAARINTSLKNEDVAFRRAQTPTPGTVTVTMDDGTPVSVPVKVYETSNHYIYYEYDN